MENKKQGMNEVIIGLGEIGKAVQEAICLNMARVIEVGTTTEEMLEMTDPDVLHVCFPYTDSFVDDLTRYITLLNPKHVIIYSTLPIGTCEKVGDRVVHSPVEGVHPHLADSIMFMERWLGYNNKEESYFFNKYFRDMGFRTKLVNSTRFTEALKLLSTTEYGINIEFARYKKMVADEIGMDFELTKEWNLAYNKLYKNLGMDERNKKYVLDAPNGPKGGHCVTPNARLLHEDFPSDFTRIVGEL